MTTPILLAAFLSAVLTLTLAPLCIRLATHVGMIDLPGSLPHKTHTSPVALANLLAAIMASVSIFTQVQCGQNAAASRDFQ